MGEKTIIVHSAEDLAQALAAHVLQVAEDAVAARARFTLALSGGSAMTVLAEGLKTVGSPAGVDWSAWHLYWADERCVPKTHPDSNAAAAQQAWLSESPIPAGQIHSMDDSLPPAAAAEAYAAVLAEGLHPANGELPQFDLILLGVGEDGHTASLFPGNPALDEQHRWVVAVENSPKPPPDRITLTLPVIQQARHVAVVAAGAGKAAVMARVRESGATQPLLPIQRIRSGPEEISWFLDAAAAGVRKGAPALNQGASE